MSQLMVLVERKASNLLKSVDISSVIVFLLYQDCSAITNLRSPDGCGGTAEGVDWADGKRMWFSRHWSIISSIVVGHCTLED